MPAADDIPVTDAELEALFEAVSDRQAVALAISGGPDSLALLLLAHRWRRARTAGPELCAFTVDHRLRPESRAEAAFVARIAEGFGLRHRTLVWGGVKPRSGIEEAAREARYELLLAAAIEVGATDILTAHHRDDQAETVLMRLGRGSGLAGLAGMRPGRPLGAGVTLRRPFLGLAKARLAATVVAGGLTAMDDLSNRDERFARARLRRAMRILAGAGVEPAGIATAAARLARADEAVEAYVDELLRRAATVDRFGVARADRTAYREAPAEIRLRALARLVAAGGGSAWPPPRAERLEALDAAVAGQGRIKRTLAGAVVTAGGEGILVHRESGRVRLPELAIAPGDSGIWDGRFAFRVEDGPRGLSIGPLGADGRHILGDADTTPAAVLATLPAIRLGGEIIAVPPAGYRLEGVAIAAQLESVVERRLWR